MNRVNQVVTSAIMAVLIAWFLECPDCQLSRNDTMLTGNTSNHQTKWRKDAKKRMSIFPDFAIYRIANAGKLSLLSQHAVFMNMEKPFFRLGTSSYIIPADILPNIEFLKDRVQDIELILFESDEYSNLPNAGTIARLREAAAAHDLTYTVHFPLDANVGSADEAERASSVQKWIRVFQLMEAVGPLGYLVHFHADTRHSNPPSADIPRWQNQLHRSVQELLAAGLPPDRLCVETLSYPLHYADPIIEEHNLSICLDVGHLVLSGQPVEETISHYLPRTRIIHLHGVSGDQDHLGLGVLSPAVLKQWLAWLNADGRAAERVLTVEIFSEEHFTDSMRALRACGVSLPKKGMTYYG